MFKRNKIILIFTCLIFAVIIVSCKSDEEKPHVHTEGAWQIVEESTCTKEGLKQTKCTECNEVISSAKIDMKEHNFKDNVCQLCSKINPPKTYVENGVTYINIGKYPQTVVTDENLINKLSEINTVNSNGYIEYNNEEYKSLKAYPAISGMKFNNETEIIKDKVYYFKVEQIKWRVIFNRDNSYILLCESLIDTTPFSLSYQTRTIKGETIYKTNYQYSNIRAWLNGYNGTEYSVTNYTNKGFYNIAFNDYEKSLLNLTEFNDAVYILGLEEATYSEFGFSGIEENSLVREATITDYSLANKASVITGSNGKYIGSWHLRTNYDNEYIYNVGLNGDIGNSGIPGSISSAIRPAITISLKEDSCNGNHQESNWQTLKESNCFEPGIKQTICNICQIVLNKEIYYQTEHMYVDNICTTCNHKKESPYLTVYEENGQKYINIGKYPQSEVFDFKLIEELDKINEVNEIGYIEYNGEEYLKTTVVSKGLYYCFNSGILIDSQVTHYFKVEPIKWRILTTSGNKYTLLSESIIDGKQYYNNPSSRRKIDDITVYANNYKYSDIRAWLNGYDGTSYDSSNYTNNGFYDIAFTEEEKALINTTLVKNDLSSTGDSYNYHISDDTNDKIYLLSYADITNLFYKFPSNADPATIRQATTSDYARGKYIRIDEQNTYGNGYWLLRTPRNTKPEYIKFVSIDGSAYTYDTLYCNSDEILGIRPSMEITLNN